MTTLKSKKMPPKEPAAKPAGAKASRSRILDRVRFRDARPTDIPACFDIEKVSYPDDEAASMSALQYRQHHVAPYFRVAILLQEEPEAAECDSHDRADSTDADAAASSKKSSACAKKPAAASGVDIEDDEEGELVGFICSTRCRAFTEQSMATHIPGGPLLAIHSVAVDPNYRRQGIATAMLDDYIQTVFDRQIFKSSGDDLMSGGNSSKTKMIFKIVLLAKAHLLTFYVHAGFSVLRPSPIQHGAEQWYELELDLLSPAVFRIRSKTSKSSTASGGASSKIMLPPPPPPPCLDCFVVDAFCDPHQPDGTGNPAAVVICSSEVPPSFSDDELLSDGTVIWDEPLTKAWMQQVAAEFNLAETAFVWRLPNETDDAESSNKAKTGGSGISSSEQAVPPAAATRAQSDPQQASSSSSSAAVPLPPPAPRRSSEASISSDRKEKKEKKPPPSKQQQQKSRPPPKKKKRLHFGIRYYTPAVEIPLCGHATLASAAVLYQTCTELLMDSKNETALVFHARQDVLTAELRAYSSRDPLTRITMEFPTKPATLPLEGTNAESAIRSMMHSAIGVDLEDIIHVGLSEIGDVLVELTHESFCDLEKINHEAFLEWDGYSRGVIVCCENLLRQRGADETDTAAGDDTASQYGGSRTGLVELEDVDFYSRFFAPKAGINEDPVTGSAHCVLAPYFGAKFNKDHVVGHQLSKRGGVVDCQLVVNSNNKRKQQQQQPQQSSSSSSSSNSSSTAAAAAAATTVKLTGSASTVVTGTLWMKRSVAPRDGLGGSISNVMAVP